MTAVLINGPAIEPVSLAKAKAHLRVDIADEDALISSLITAARIHVEAYTHQVFINQSWSIYLDCWPNNQPLRLPVSPVQSVNAINIYADDNSFTIADPVNYVVDSLSKPPRISWQGSGSVPTPGRQFNGIEIVVDAGYGATENLVPQPINQSILFLVALWFEHREPPVLEGCGDIMPSAIAPLLKPFLPPVRVC